MVRLIKPNTLKLTQKSVLCVRHIISFKVAEIKRSGSSYKLTGYAAVDLPEGALIEDDIQKATSLTHRDLNAVPCAAS